MKMKGYSHHEEDEYGMRDKVLEGMDDDMGEYEYEKKLKPLLTITIAAGGEMPEMDMEEYEDDEEYGSYEDMMKMKK